jgi:spore coat protein U-like protein
MAATKGLKRVWSGLLAVIFIGLTTGADAAHCSLIFNAAPLAMLLPITAVTPQRIQVGTLIQDCSGNASFSLVVASGNCPHSPTGAKLMDPITLEFVRYSVEFDNPTTGGSLPIITGLLAAACSGADGRDVIKAKISNESSAIFLNFTGSDLLAAGTYSDTLSVKLNMN